MIRFATNVCIQYWFALIPTGPAVLVTVIFWVRSARVWMISRRRPTLSREMAASFPFVSNLLHVYIVEITGDYWRLLKIRPGCKAVHSINWMYNIMHTYCDLLALHPCLLTQCLLLAFLCVYVLLQWLHVLSVSEVNTILHPCYLPRIHVIVNYETG